MSANPQRQDIPEQDRKAAGPGPIDANVLWDTEVMGSIAAGEEAGMLLLYDKYSPLVFNLALQVLNDRNLAEDVVQEVFFQIWRNPHCFRSTRGRLGGWLAVVTRHRAIDVLRKRRRECSIDLHEPSDDKFQIQIEVSQAAGKVAAIFPSMPPEQQEALGLAYFEGLSHSEISSKTGEPLGTIKSRIRLALGFLRKGLGGPGAGKKAQGADATATARRSK